MEISDFLLSRMDDIVCFKAGSLPPDILEVEWKWMYMGYVGSLMGFSVLVVILHAGTFCAFYSLII